MTNSPATPRVLSAEELTEHEFDQFSQYWKGDVQYRKELEREVRQHQDQEGGVPEIGGNTLLTPDSIRQAAFARIDSALKQPFNFDLHIEKERQKSFTLNALEDIFLTQLEDYLQALVLYANEKKRGEVTSETQAKVTNTSALIMRQLEAHSLLAHPRSLSEGWNSKIEQIRNFLVGLGYNPYSFSDERVQGIDQLWGKAQPPSLRNWLCSAHFCAVFPDERRIQSLEIATGSFGIREHLMLMSSREDIEVRYVEGSVNNKVYTVLSNGGYEEAHE